MIYVIAIVVAVLRFFIEPRFNLPTTTGCYETFAHMFFGVVVVLWWQTWSEKDLWRVSPLPGWINRYLFVGMVPALIELVMFLVQKHAHDLGQ